MVEAVRELIRRHALEVAAERLALLPHPGWGGDSDAWLIDDRWIFRFPRTPEVARSLAVECRLLPRLAPRLALAIPRFVHVARDTADQPSFVGYPAIPGEPLRRETLDVAGPEVAARLAEQLGAFLTALHEFPLAEAIACGLSSPEDPRIAMERRFDRVRAIAFPVLEPDERRRLTARFEAYLADSRHFLYAPTLCHGDLGGDHLLYDAGSSALTGVIDFGDACVGDPAGDFTWRAEYGEDFFRAVLRHYRAPRDGSLPVRVAFLISLLPLIELMSGVETGRQDYVEEGRSLLRREFDRQQVSSAQIRAT